MSTASGRRFEGKTILITGAGSGIGRAAAMRFAGEGAQVVIADYNGTAADETAASGRSGAPSSAPSSSASSTTGST